MFAVVSMRRLGVLVDFVSLLTLRRANRLPLLLVFELKVSLDSDSACIDRWEVDGAS